MEHQYSLKWNNHPSNISTVFSRLRDEELFVDVTLATLDKKVIHAHRVVLSAGSGYLQKILALTPSDHPTIVLSNLMHRELKLLVDFMYSGEIAVDQPLLAGLLDAANWLQIKGLYENKVEPPAPAGVVEAGASSPDLNVSSCSDDQPQRKRARSGESDARSTSPECVSESSPPPPPAKLSKPVFGLTNNAWIMDSVKQKDAVVKPEQDLQDIPSLLSMANRQNFFQQFKAEPPKPAAPAAEQTINEQMLQAMQLCGTNYLSQLAALQNCSQNKPMFTGSFTSFAANNSPPSNLKSGILLNSAPVRRYKQYTEDSLQAALKDIMEGQSINRSSMKHNIPARTLRDWMKRLNIKSVYTHHSSNKEGSVGSTSPEPDLALSLEKLRNAAFSGVSANSFTDMDDDEPETLKIDESCENLNSRPEMAA